MIHSVATECLPCAIHVLNLTKDDKINKDTAIMELFSGELIKNK